jgi:hypothetical protein
VPVRENEFEFKSSTIITLLLELVVVGGGGVEDFVVVEVVEEVGVVGGVLEGVTPGYIKQKNENLRIHLHYLTKNKQKQ